MKNQMFQKIKMKYVVTVMGLMTLLMADEAHADLNSSLISGQTFIKNIGTTLNIGAGIVGAYLIFNGIMTWKKSSSDHGQQVEFKSIAIPLVAGSALLAFSTFVGLTSSTFGFNSNYQTLTQS